MDPKCVLTLIFANAFQIVKICKIKTHNKIPYGSLNTSHVL